MVVRNIINGRSIDHYKDMSTRETGLALPEESAYFPRSTSNGYAPNDFIADSSLVLYLPFWALAGSKFKSVDRYQHTCTVTGATWTPQGRTFAGAEYIDLTNVLTASLSTTTTGTLSLWVRTPDATPASDYLILCFGDADANEQIVLRWENDGLMHSYLAVAGTIQWNLDTDGAVMVDKTWQLVTLTQDGTEPVIYIAGEKPAQAFITTTDKTVWFAGCAGLDNGFLGKGSYGNLANLLPYTGDIGEVRIYNRALAPAEVLHNYNATVWRYQ